MSNKVISIDKDLNLFTLDDPRQKVNLSETWANGKVLLKIFRRFGCPSCRYEAKVLSNYKKTFEALGVRVIGIGFDEEGLEDWNNEKIWDFELLMDPGRDVYKQLDLTCYGTFMGLITCFKTQERKSYAAAKELGLGGNLTVGDGRQLGATYIIEQGKVLYEFKQGGYGDYPSLKQIVEVAGGDSSVVEVKDDLLSRTCNLDVCTL